MNEKAGSLWSRVPQGHGAQQAKSDCPQSDPNLGSSLLGVPHLRKQVVSLW